MTTAAQSILDAAVAPVVADVVTTLTIDPVNAGKVAGEAELCIYNLIGTGGVTAAHFTSQLKTITSKSINVRLNSMGGSVIDGTAIYNALKSHPARIVVYIEGVAASAASFIA